MKRTIAALALFLLASPAAALERSPDNRGHDDQGGRGHQAAERGDRESGHDRGREGERRSGSRSTRSGHAGSRHWER